MGQLVGLFAGVAGLIYFTGAVVLSLRLAFEHLPWANVVSELPKEFVISTGVGQVLLPALIAGSLYGIFRLLRKKAPGAPALPRWRDGGVAKLAALGGYVIGLALMLLPLAVVLLVRGLDSGFEPQTTRIFAALGVLTVVAVAAHEARIAVIRWLVKRALWHTGQGAALMAVLYVVAATPAMTIAAAAVPLSEAKVCSTGGYPESGFLVGESDDRVYLGEQGDPPRRLAVFPLTKVEELFIGDQAAEAACEWAPPRSGDVGGGGSG